MEYTVVVATPVGTLGLSHRYVYRGDDEAMAREIARHYTRPIDGISADVIQSATEADGLGWIGTRLLSATDT